MKTSLSRRRRAHPPAGKRGERNQTVFGGAYPLPVVVFVTVGRGAVVFQVFSAKSNEMGPAPRSFELLKSMLKLRYAITLGVEPLTLK